MSERLANSLGAGAPVSPLMAAKPDAEGRMIDRRLNIYYFYNKSLIMEGHMLNGTEVANLLRERGFTHIYHANTAATALSFLRNGGLLSRQYVESSPATSFQTIQASDTKDKQFGIYNDIFFDAKNIWECNCICFYGPVIFEYAIQVLEGKSNVAIMKKNPQNCESEPEYFSSFLEVTEKHFVPEYWEFGEHITLRHQSKVDFTYLQRVIVYMPPENIDLSISDPRNSPYDACEDLRRACSAHRIAHEAKQMTKAQWDAITAVGRFYGFRSCVPCCVS